MKSAIPAKFWKNVLIWRIGFSRVNISKIRGFRLFRLRAGVRLLYELPVQESG